MTTIVAASYRRAGRLFLIGSIGLGASVLLISIAAAGDRGSQVSARDGGARVVRSGDMAFYDEPARDDSDQSPGTPGAYVTVTKTQAGCHSLVHLNKLIGFARVKDGRGTSAFLAERIAANECVILMLGDTVKIDATTDHLSNRVCVLPEGQRTCFWALSDGFNFTLERGH